MGDSISHFKWACICISEHLKDSWAIQRNSEKAPRTLCKSLSEDSKKQAAVSSLDQALSSQEDFLLSPLKEWDSHSSHVKAVAVEKFLLL